MPHPICFITDSVVIGTVSAVTAVSIPILASAPNSELLLFILPLIGSLIMSGGMILLNPEPETRKIVIGRSIIALLCGVTFPQAIGMFYQTLDPVTMKPAVLVLIGAICAGLSYVLSKPFFRQLYIRAEGVAKKAADELEKKAGLDSGNQER